MPLETDRECQLQKDDDCDSAEQTAVHSATNQSSRSTKRRKKRESRSKRKSSWKRGGIRDFIGRSRSSYFWTERLHEEVTTLYGTTLSMISEPLNLSELLNLQSFLCIFSELNLRGFRPSIYPLNLFVNECMNHSDILTV